MSRARALFLVLALCCAGAVARADDDADAIQAQIDAYVQLAKHEDERVRAKALEMLGGLGAKGKRGLTCALRLLKEDPESSVREAAAHAAGRLGAPKAIVAPLALALADKELEVRLAAAEELARCGPAAAPAVGPLRACLSNTTQDALQINACRALGAVGKGAAPAQAELVGCLNDVKRPRLVREAAAFALGEIGVGPGVLAALTATLSAKDSGLREAGALALGALGPAAAKASPALGKALTHTDALTRWRAAQALAAIGPAARAALPQLVAALQKDVGRDIRSAAAVALGSLGDKRAIAPLRAHLSRPREHHTVQLAVEQALKRLEAIK